MLVVGKVLKIHGLKGELKVQSYLDSPDLFSRVSKVTLKGTVRKVGKARTNGAFVLLKLDGIDTPEEAQTYAGEQIFAEKEDVPALPEGRYFIADLIGCIVMCEKERVGKIKDVLQYGAADVIVMTKEGKRIMAPWVNGLFVSVDVEKKIILADKRKLDEVAVYED